MILAVLRKNFSGVLYYTYNELIKMRFCLHRVEQDFLNDRIKIL